MQKLREVIEQHTRWAELNTYLDRIESSRDLDFSLALENAKALVECICKEICSLQNRPLTANSSMNGALKSAFSVLGYTNSSMVTRISASLASIGEEVGNLRNEIGSTAHGRTLQEMRERNNTIDLLTKDFLLDSIRTIAIFLLRTCEERNACHIVPEEPVPMQHEPYESFEEFNDFWDETFNEFVMGDYSYPASLAFYHVDNEAYQYERKQFEESKE